MTWIHYCILYMLHENTLKVDKTVAYGMSKVRDHSLRVIGSRLIILVNNSNPCVSTLLLDKGLERVCIRISVLQLRKASLFRRLTTIANKRYRLFHFVSGKPKSGWWGGKIFFVKDRKTSVESSHIQIVFLKG